VADWTNLPDTTFEPGAPAKGRDMRFLRDNPIAIAEGAAGAPRVRAAGLATGNNERDWVLARTAAAQANAVGTYALMRHSRSTQNQTLINTGDTLPGSQLRFAYVELETGSNARPGDGSAPTPSGTWRCMGLGSGSASPGDGTGGWLIAYTTLWLRIS
jgi:hypothetical protein